MVLEQSTDDKNQFQQGEGIPSRLVSPIFSLIPKSWVSLSLGFLVALLTGLVFSGVLDLGWTNWDDDKYVYENPLVLNQDYRHSLTTPVNFGYNPLPGVMYAWEWNQVKANPSIESKARLFHLDNLWMHILTTILVFWLMQMLGLKPLWAAFAALLFGIHPMRVESVAWITERKDVMFGMFYVGALLTYVRYVDTKKFLWIGLTAILFTLSLLSKVQAVSLPLSMMAIDWYRGRQRTWKMFAEKIPFFVGSVLIGYVGIMVMFLDKGGTLRLEATFGLMSRLVLALHGYFVYLLKAIIPYENTAFYPYPAEVGPFHYLGAALAIAVIVVAFWLRKVRKELWFGLIFFTVNIVFVLQVLDTGTALGSDRMSYIPHIGLCFSLCMTAQRITMNRKMLRIVAAGALVVLSSCCAFLTMRYVPVWTNSDTLWTDVIEKYPRSVQYSYVNRGQYYRMQGQNDRAMADMNVAVECWPAYPLPYLNRGNIFFDLGEDRKASLDYTKVIELYWPLDSADHGNRVIGEALRNRGAALSRMGMRSEALVDLKSALEINPHDAMAWSNRAIIKLEMGDYRGAMMDFNELLVLNPKDAAALDARGVCQMNLNNVASAMKDFDAAIALSPKQPSFYINRANLWASMGNAQNANADAAKAQSLSTMEN